MLEMQDPAIQRPLEPSTADMLERIGYSLILSKEFCEACGLSSHAFDKALLGERAFAVEIDGQLFVPNFYLDKRYDYRQLASISKVLCDLRCGSKLQFFTTPKGSLGGQTPLEALADRKFAAVRRTAQGFAER